MTFTNRFSSFRFDQRVEHVVKTTLDVLLEVKMMKDGEQQTSVTAAFQR